MTVIHQAIRSSRCSVSFTKVDVQFVFIYIVSVALKLFHFAGGQQKMIHSMFASGSTAQPGHKLDIATKTNLDTITHM